ncbi:MAG TPA: 3'(2'),5'-bisphosphate nucleotidase CysQ [Polyangiaceae bacterium]|nr:3'(2'),5'-bisphosphate nucleotidase CysQ [Polyangiaceae bacterium]
MTTLDVMLRVAVEASAVIAEVYETPFSVDFKAPEDPVTAADRRANTLICERLSQAFPGVPLVAEESDPETFAGYRTAERVFFVDPLDGTAEFVNRNGEFVVMIGLFDGDRATTGVVLAPASGVAWIGEVGQGAWSVTANGLREPIRVSSVATLAESRVVTSRTHRSPMLERTLALLAAREVVTLGSAGLKGAEIAAAGAEVYVGPGMVGKRWDACAIDAIIVAAGGRFTDTSGAAFDYRAPSLVNDRGLTATNGLVHEAVLECLRKLEP